MVRRLACPVVGCTWGEGVEAGGIFKTEEDYDTLDQALRMMELHVKGHKLGAAASTPAPPVNQNQSRILKSVSPKVEAEKADMVSWESWSGKWTIEEGAIYRESPKGHQVWDKSL